MFLRALPDLIVCLQVEAEASEPANDRPPRPCHCPSAARYIADGIPLYGRNVCSKVFGPIPTSNMYVFTEDLARAEHCVWPKAAEGTYTDLAVRIDEFTAFLQKEIDQHERTRNQPIVLRPGIFDDD